MRYAVFTDIHANLEALEAVLAKIDEIAKTEPIDEIWFLGDLVGYGPNPNECILKLRERTDVIIAGNHDWAAVGKIDLEDFSAHARISAEWTAEQLTPEHREFLANLPERLIKGEVTLVHGSPFGPLWEYLTSEVLAERSFQYFSTRYCFVGHTHVPIIFQQPDTIANTPTLPLTDTEQDVLLPIQPNGIEKHTAENDEEAGETVTVHPSAQQSMLAAQLVQEAASAYRDPESGLTVSEAEANAIIESHLSSPDMADAARDIAINETVQKAATGSTREMNTLENEDHILDDADKTAAETPTNNKETMPLEAELPLSQHATSIHHPPNEHDISGEDETPTEAELTAVTAADAEGANIPPGPESPGISQDDSNPGYKKVDDPEGEEDKEMTPESAINNTEDRLNSEIEELLALLGLSQSMIQVTNEMLTPPEGHWEAPHGYRAIINPGGVGQPRDNDPRAAFMIYDTERGFEFYRVPYAIEKTQEKIIRAGLPHYLAVRLAYGR
ncbi:MAG TPA: metallophosphoesterase [Ktedonobacteraceae bacterium]|jgi:diadenosine tetraphosphatase ApaH/serine/threonine PP2A family protein phosphatase|nr:metallophosphoesterase [Ktedonobacteraceae bacterium]